MWIYFEKGLQISFKIKVILVSNQKQKQTVNYKHIIVLLNITLGEGY